MLLGILFLCCQLSAMMPPSDPAIVEPPRSGQAELGGDFIFEVEASGAEPLSYQWRFNNRDLAGATNNILLLTNVSSRQTGNYSVRVTNLLGSVTSSNAALALTTDSPRALTVDGPINAGTGVVALVTFFANGLENGFALSLGYNTNVLRNPGFALALTNAMAELDLDQTSAGLVGVRVTLPPGERFERTNHQTGAFTFELIPGAELSQSGLFLTNAPSALQGIDIDGQPLSVKYELFLPITLLDPSPLINAQSGLFEQRVQLVNATPNTLSNLVVAVHGLGVDSRTNAILLFNRQFTDTADLNNDGSRETALQSVRVPTLAAGEQTTLTMEYYVSDHTTLPDPQYTEVLGLTVTFTIPRGEIRAIRAARFVDGDFLVEFNTRAGFDYYVQYAGSMEDLMTDPMTAFPFVLGTGSAVRWIDNGPPKTRSAPQDSMRFYRVLEVAR